MTTPFIHRTLNIPAPVTSLALNEAGNLLVGSDDGSLRIYDLSTFKVLRAARSLGFEISSIACVENDQADVWLACGGKAMLLPTNSPKLILTPDDITKSLTISQDDIDVLNKLALNESRSYLAYSLDSGVVGIVNLMTGVIQGMRTRHDSICGSVSFIPNRPSEIVSTGYDSAVLHFDFMRGVMLSRCDIATSPPASDNVSLSPPFILSASVSSSGIFAAGTADGRLLVCTGGEKRHGVTKKTRKWEGLNGSELVTKVAEGPIVALPVVVSSRQYNRLTTTSHYRTFTGPSIFTFSTLLGTLHEAEICTGRVDGSRTLRTLPEGQAKDVHKVNDLVISGGMRFLGGLSAAAKGVVEVIGREPVSL